MLSLLEAWQYQQLFQYKNHKVSNTKSRGTMTSLPVENAPEDAPSERVKYT